MILNNLDLKILKEFNSLSENAEKNPTTWEIMLRIFPNIKKEYNKKVAHQRIKDRMKRMDKKLFLVKKNKEGFLEYIMIKDNVIFCKHKFPSGIKPCVMVKDEDGWMILQL